VVAAREERRQAEDELERLPRWHFRRRAELERAVARARHHEEALLTALGGKASP
jgi:hypothetical protein